MSYLLDTNTIVYYLKGGLPQPDSTFRRFTPREDEFLDAIFNVRPQCSIVTQIELLSKPGLDPSEKKRVETVLTHSLIYEVGQELTAEAIRIRRDHRLKLPDALIAATAIVHDLELVSGNFHDYEKVSSLKFRNLFAL